MKCTVLWASVALALCLGTTAAGQSPRSSYGAAAQAMQQDQVVQADKSEQRRAARQAAVQQHLIDSRNREAQALVEQREAAIERERNMAARQQATEMLVDRLRHSKEVMRDDLQRLTDMSRQRLSVMNDPLTRAPTRQLAAPSDSGDPLADQGLVEPGNSDDSPVVSRESKSVDATQYRLANGSRSTTNESPTPFQDESQASVRRQAPESQTRQKTAHGIGEITDPGVYPDYFSPEMVIGGVRLLKEVPKLATVAASLRCTSVQLHPVHHTFPLLGRSCHLQVNCYLKGVKGSGYALRIPVPDKLCPKAE